MDTLRAWIRELFGLDNPFPKKDSRESEVYSDDPESLPEGQRYHNKSGVGRNGPNPDGTEQQTAPDGASQMEERMKYREAMAYLCDGDKAAGGKERTVADYSGAFRRGKDLYKESPAWRRWLVRYFGITVADVTMARRIK